MDWTSYKLLSYILPDVFLVFFMKRESFLTKCETVFYPAVTYMELNMPMRAVKQKPMANMDFIRTYKTNTQDLKHIHLTINT